MSVVIGIDTSCYTTSVCAVDLNSNIIGDYRRILQVKDGNRGLRQSEAVFQHMNNLPNLISSLFDTLHSQNICAVAVSSKPRPLEDSYMPVFSVSNNIGSVLAASLKVPLLKYSHQEGHISAGIWSAGGPNTDEFLCLHLSGGTTELLKVNKEKNNYNIDIISKTLDISAGQLVDRVGVLLGLSFPCGAELEVLAQKGESSIIIPSCVKECDMSFSGAETFVMNKLKEHSKEDIAFAVQKCIAKTLEKVIFNASNKYNIKEILLVGGVASNNFIRKYLSDRLSKCTLFFGQSQYCVDNSVGIAILGVDYAKANIDCK